MESFAGKMTYQRERDQAIADLYKRNLSARQIAYNLKVSHEEVLDVIELFNLKEIKVEGRYTDAVQRRRIEEHQQRIRCNEM